MKMKFSDEEIYAMFGQYDTNVTVEFKYKSESYQKFGSTIMGSFHYFLKERQELQNVINATDIPRTEKKIKFILSSLETSKEAHREDLERCGILCSDVEVVFSVNMQRTNRFAVEGKKEIPNRIQLNISGMGTWQQLNRTNFGFIHSRFEKKSPIAPEEMDKYLGLRKHFGYDIENPDFKNLIYNKAGEVKNRVRFYELDARFRELIITETEVKELARYIIEDIDYKDIIINEELKKATEKINEVATRYNDEILNLKQICNRFSEKILLFGSNKLIYLDFERFVHIYVRHVAETQIGERFIDDKNKTVFQYKFDDIIEVISSVLTSISGDIEEHFNENPNKEFRRMGTRGVYFDGHYYRVEIEPNGRLKTFHPYNINIPIAE